MGSKVRIILFIAPLAVFAILAGYFLWGLSDDRGNPNEVPTVMIEKPIPEFDFAGQPLLERRGFKSEDLRAGEVVVVNFFASWCVPCRAEHGVLTKLVEEEGVKLWGVNHRDEPQDAKAFLDELGNPYERIGIDPGRGVIGWGAYGLPETFVIDGTGTIRYHFRGPLVQGIIDRELLPVLRALES
ncbi:MAG: DsbE family thiol:disulfide interchange protein [Kiloniellales bacterium]|nr:DsbE family thiol:disulfide interchange protein [Kiloniellales bacterium]